MEAQNVPSIREGTFPSEEKHCGRRLSNRGMYIASRVTPTHYFRSMKQLVSRPGDCN